MQKFANRDYLVFDDEVISYGEAHRQCGQIAHAIIQKYNVRKVRWVVFGML